MHVGNFVFLPKIVCGGSFLFSFQATWLGTLLGGCKFVFLLGDLHFTNLTKSTDSPKTSANDEKTLEPW